MLASIWIKLKVNFWKHKNLNLYCGLDTLMIFFFWTHGKEKLERFMEDFHVNMFKSLMSESSKT